MSRITLEQVQTSERFLKIPLALTEARYYRNLSADAKLLYGILKNRFQLSVKNKWVDENNCVYLIYKVNDLCEVLGYGRDKVIKLKKELIKYSLMDEVKQGLNRPNLIYLRNVETNEDVLQSDFHPKKGDETPRQIRKSEIPTSGGRKNRLLEVENSDSNKTNNKKIENNKYISSRKIDSEADTSERSAGADEAILESNSGYNYVAPQYYSLLQVIADAYAGKFNQFSLEKGHQNYYLTHHQKMKIGQFLSSGYVTSNEVLNMIERMPVDCDSPLAYLFRMLDNLKEERRLEAKYFAHQKAKAHYAD